LAFGRSWGCIAAQTGEYLLAEGLQLMANSVPQRITGLETEYGCLVHPPTQVQEVLPRVRDWLFEKQRYGLIDLEPRGWDEPAGNGGFLFNGGRVYLDMGHFEYCTPECTSAADIVRYDRAGDLLLLEAVQALGLQGQVSFIRNNVDYYTSATFGCHENYSFDRSMPWSKKNLHSFLAFLTLRVLFTGAGRVGCSRPNPFREEALNAEESVPFQLSQRADFIMNDCFQWVQHNRAILNLRDEPLADPQRFRRLHLIHGDTNVLPASLFLKVGTTRLVLDLLEADELPPVILEDPVASFRALSRTPKPPWRVTLGNGRTADALALLGHFHRKAKLLFAGRDAETDAVLSLWSRALDGLAGDRSTLVGVVDWVTKHYLLSEFCRREGLCWSDPWLESQDLEYHHIDPNRSLGLALAVSEPDWAPDRLDHSKREPPRTSRAHARSRLMREIQGKSGSYRVDWAEVAGPNEKRSHLPNPFQA
jgi:proteasome accessory factor A